MIPTRDVLDAYFTWEDNEGRLIIHQALVEAWDEDGFAMVSSERLGRLERAAERSGFVAVVRRTWGASDRVRKMVERDSGRAT
jgi:hypothetical protein